jgi:hypothetical protein
MAQGCCRPARPSFPVVTWAAKAGSGWRLLTLTGVVDLPDGRVMAYTYINHESATRHAEDMERQIGPVVAWIDRTLAALRR